MTYSDRLREYSSYSSSSVYDSMLVSKQKEMDDALSRLIKAAKVFAMISIDERVKLALCMQQGYKKIAEGSVIAGCTAKGITLGTPAEAEEWATGPWGIIRQLRLICESLLEIKKTGNTKVGKIYQNIAGNLSVNVFPNNAIDGMLFKNVTVEVQMQPHVTLSSLDSDRARFYKKPNHEGLVVLVLGAGNIAAIGVMDVITKMFNEGKVCLLKMNPVNAYLGPFIEEAFKEAIDKNYLAIIYGGVEEGRHLVYHPSIDEVHLTGSHKTYNQIVWGPTEMGQQARIAANEPLLKKTITSELGNISPVIIIPGPYTHKEVLFQADAIAAAMTMNASFFCNSAKMLVNAKDWEGSNQFLKAIQDICSSIEPRQAYYPGAMDRWQTLTRGGKNLKYIGKPSRDALPWTFISGLNPQDDSEILYKEEPFCSILSEVLLGSSDPIHFLEEAVEFCNNKLWGSLNVTIIVHPKSLKDPIFKKAFEQAIHQLQYGTVAINTFPGISFVFASPPWGAYPNTSSDDIQSGRGFVHNTLMLEGIEKTVIRAPLTVFPKPGFFATHKTAHKVMRGICEMEEKASWGKVARIVLAAMQG